MPVQQASYFCPQCRQKRLFTAQTMNHTPHILATVFLCGLWLPVWILLAAGEKPVYHCSQCGFGGTRYYLANPNLSKQQADNSLLNAGYNNEKFWKLGVSVLVLFLLAGFGSAFCNRQQRSQQFTPNQSVITPTPYPSIAPTLAPVKGKTNDRRRTS